MSKSLLFLSRRKRHLVLAIALLTTMFLMTERLIWAQSTHTPAAAASDASLLDGFRHVEVASVSYFEGHQLLKLLTSSYSSLGHSLGWVMFSGLSISSSFSFDSQPFSRTRS